MNNSENKSNQNTLFETTMEISNKELNDKYKITNVNTEPTIEKTDTQKYSDRILQYLNVDRYYKLVNSLGPQLNGRKDRFDKSDIIEQSIEVYSNGKFKWVDQEGYDLLDQEQNIKIEVKNISLRIDLMFSLNFLCVVLITTTLL